MKTKYSPDFPLLAEGLARSGLTDRQIAKKLGISKTAFYEYLKLHPDFADSLKKGKSPVDTEVENALLKRALGYEYEEVMTEYDLAGKDKDQKALPAKVRKTRKEIIPDVTAQIFWLKNRRPDKWRDKHDFDFPGGVEFRIISAVPRPERRGE
jgi:predicted transcriptional regulator